jgi:hypothetical protein
LANLPQETFTGRSYYLLADLISDLLICLAWRYSLLILDYRLDIAKRSKSGAATGREIFDDAIHCLFDPP